MERSLFFLLIFLGALWLLLGEFGSEKRITGVVDKFWGDFVG